jgi:signal peptidase II
MIFEIIFVIILVGIDQWTKLLTIQHLANGNQAITIIDGVFELTYVENTGAAFGMFQDATLILSILVIVILAVILYFKSKLPITPRYKPLHILSLFIIAGAIGNLIDRIRLSYVVDMLHFYWFEFPVFNVADMYVTCSAVLLMILLLTKYRDLEI